MDEPGIKSCYTAKSYRNCCSDGCNAKPVSSLIARNFDCRSGNEVIVSGLTYVNVNGIWHYLCIMVDLFNREIAGFSADRDREFDNRIIDEVLHENSVLRSLSKKECPYDNAVTEVIFKIIKTELVKGRIFSCFEQLQLECADYVHWYNNCRIHSSLSCMTPVEFRKAALKSATVMHEFGYPDWMKSYKRELGATPDNAEQKVVI
jgi:putative transposase